MLSSYFYTKIMLFYGDSSLFVVNSHSYDHQDLLNNSFHPHFEVYRRIFSSNLYTLVIITLYINFRDSCRFKVRCHYCILCAVSLPNDNSSPLRPRERERQAIDTFYIMWFVRIGWMHFYFFYAYVFATAICEQVFVLLKRLITIY